MESYPLDMQGLPVSPYRRADGETVVVLYADMAYYTSKGCIVVPKGFESDGCSMPRFFWRVFGHPFDMQYLREAILHDWLYRYQPCDRRTADKIFLAALLAGGVGPVRSRAIYRGLRIGGWSTWNRHRRRLQLAEAPTAELT